MTVNRKSDLAGGEQTPALSVAGPKAATAAGRRKSVSEPSPDMDAALEARLASIAAREAALVQRSASSARSNKDLALYIALGLVGLSQGLMWYKLEKGAYGSRIVTVGARELTQQFVAGVGVAGLDGDGVRNATRTFMEASQKATERLAGPNTVVLVREAVLNGDVVDITAGVKSIVEPQVNEMLNKRQPAGSAFKLGGQFAGQNAAPPSSPNSSVFGSSAGGVGLGASGPALGVASEGP